MTFLASRSASKHVFFALGASDTDEGGGSDLALQDIRPSQCRVIAIHVPSLHKPSIAKPRKTSSKCCKVCH